MKNDLTPKMIEALRYPATAGKATLEALERRGLVRISYKDQTRMVRNGRHFGCDYTQRTERVMVATLTDAGKVAL